jgi:hypothetical protein
MGRRVVVSFALEILISEERRFSPLLEPRVPFGVAVWRKHDMLSFGDKPQNQDGSCG